MRTPVFSEKAARKEFEQFKKEFNRQKRGQKNDDYDEHGNRARDKDGVKGKDQARNKDKQRKEKSEHKTPRQGIKINFIKSKCVERI